MYFNLSTLPLVLSVGTTEAGSLFIASHQVFMHIDKIIPELSLVQAKKSASSHMRDASGPEYFCSNAWGKSIEKLKYGY